jgi:hypothetical protein
LNTRLGLVAVILFVGFVVYVFTLSSVFFGFPPFFPSNYPYNFLSWFAIGLIVFEWSIFSLAMIEYRSRILPLTKLSITWIISTTITFVSFSILYFSDTVTKQLAIGFYFLIPLLVGCLASFISGRKIEKKIRQKEVSLPNKK